MAKTIVMHTDGLKIESVETAPVFEVKDSKNGVIGDLTVSTGGVRWRQKHKSESMLVNWEDFADLMKVHAAKK